MNNYSPRPWHVLLSLAMAAIGTAASTASDTWWWFGIISVTLGALSGIWIVLAGYWESYARYWDSLARFAQAMKDNRDPQLWAAMGFKIAEKEVKVQITRPADNTRTWGTTDIFDMPCSPQAFTALCDGVLMGQPLSETFWTKNKTFSSPVFRAVKKKLEEQKAIRLKIPDKPTQGYVLTKKGTDLFLKYCSVGIRNLVLSEQHRMSTRPILPQGVNHEQPSPDSALGAGATKTIPSHLATGE